ncbi:MAG: hypothetical protein ACE3JU_26415, partial [Paenibacillus sp.]
MFHACGTTAKTYIQGIYNSIEMWNTLQRHYDNASTRNSRNAILNQFRATRMEPTYSIASDYIAHLRVFQTQLAGSESAIDDYMLIDHLLKTLPDRYAVIACVLRQLPEDKFTIQHIESALLAEESNQQARNALVGIQPSLASTQTNATALVADIANKSPNRVARLPIKHSNRSPSRTPIHHARSNNRRYPHSQNTANRIRTLLRERTSLPDVSEPDMHTDSERCWYCNRRGHERSECKTRMTAEAREQHRNANRKDNKTTSITTAASAFVDSFLSDMSDGDEFTPATSFSALALNHDDNTGTYSVSQSTPCLVTDTPPNNISTNMEQHAGSWIIDSGASFHLTFKRDHFASLRNLSRVIPVQIANGSSYPATAIGIIYFQLTCGTQLRLSNVLYVPQLAVSLISVDALNRDGLNVTFNAYDNTCQIRHIDASRNHQWILFGARPIGSRTCLVAGKTIRPQHSETAFSSSISNNSIPSTASRQPTSVSLSLWHQRFGHLNLPDVKRALSFSHYITDQASRDLCDICCLTKAKVQYQRILAPQRASQPLETIHSDLCGPIRPASRSGFQYFLLFIDDFSRTTDVVFLRNKEKATITTAFDAYRTRKENEFAAQGYTISKFRCDNGRGEYDNDLFRSLLLTSGIAFCPSPPYCQHKNGVSERMIQTICRKVRAMLLDSGLAATFWAECVTTAVYINNRTPTSANNSSSPFEALYRIPSRIHHLRRFGCIAYITITKEQQASKFSIRAKKAIFLGYIRDSVTIWKFYLPNERRTYEASNARFDEQHVARQFQDLPIDLLHSGSDPDLDFCLDDYSELERELHTSQNTLVEESTCISPHQLSLTESSQLTLSDTARAALRLLQTPTSSPLNSNTPSPPHEPETVARSANSRSTNSAVIVTEPSFLTADWDSFEFPTVNTSHLVDSHLQWGETAYEIPCYTFRN